MDSSVEKIKEILSLGETNVAEFKTTDVRPDSLARVMVAFTNTLGGTILIRVGDNGDMLGMDRPGFSEWAANIARHNVVPAITPEISEIEIEKHRLGLISVPKGIHKPYQTIDGKSWIRVGSTNRNATKEELSRLFQQAGLVHFDLSPVESVTANDLDFQKLADYWQTYYEIPFLDLDESEQRQILINADILVPFEEDYVISVGGLLIFGKYPQRRLPQSGVVFAVFNGLEITDDLIDKKEINGALPDLIDNTSSLIQLFLARSSRIEGMKRQETELIPAKVIREALVNAVCHRDYSLVNRKITVYLFNDRLRLRLRVRLPTP